MELKATIYLHPKHDMATIAKLRARFTQPEMAGGASVSESLIGMWLHGVRGLDVAAVRALETFSGVRIVPSLDAVPLADADEIRRRRTA